MLSVQNTARAAALAGNINQAYSGPSMATIINTLADEFLIQATDVATSFADFVPFTCDGVLSLETSRLRIGGDVTAALNNTVKLQKVIGTPEVFPATLTNASTVVVSAKAGLLVGQSISGPGIPLATTITSMTATGFTISANATAGGTVDVTVSGFADITAAATVAASAATAATAAQAVSFVPLNGGPGVPFKKGDRLRLSIVAVTALGIGRLLLPAIPFTSRLSPGTTP